MSFKGIRSRLKQTAPSPDSDQGSPSRSSFFHQLASLLVPDDSRVSSKEDLTDSNGRQLEDQLLSLVMDQGDPAATAVPDNEDSADQGSTPRPFLVVSGLLPGGNGRSDSMDLDSDRESSLAEDSSRPTSATQSPSVSIRRRALHQSSAERASSSSRYRFGRRDKRRSERSKSLERSTTPGSRDDANAAGNEEEEMKGGAAASSPPSPSSISQLPHRRIAAWARELMDDLQSIEDAHSGRPKDGVNGTTAQQDDPGEPLAVKRLKNNVVRFGRITGAISGWCDSIQSLKQWQSPTATLLFILILSYAIWHGLFLSMLVAAILLKLTINYLASQGWLRHTNGELDEDGAEESSSSSVADRVAVVIQVARKVQNQLGAVCDAAEKIKNLLMWRHEASRRLYLALWLALPLTLLLPAAQLSTCLGFYFLAKFLVIDFLFLRFPRLRAKYDSSPLMWDDLPTDADLDARSKLEKGLCNAAACSSNNESKTFWELFNLPPTESPLPGWHNGQRCTLVNRDKSLTLQSFKSGRLFLTVNHLCFERSKTQPGKNIVIPLDRIVRLEKGNQYSWIPGGGMIIEVFIQGLDRAYTFGAIMNRDDVFDAIRSAAEKLGCVWREDKSPSPA